MQAYRLEEWNFSTSAFTAFLAQNRRGTALKRQIKWDEGDGENEREKNQIPEMKRVVNQKWR